MSDGGEADTQPRSTNRFKSLSLPCLAVAGVVTSVFGLIALHWTFGAYAYLMIALCIAFDWSANRGAEKTLAAWRQEKTLENAKRFIQPTIALLILLGTVAALALDKLHFTWGRPYYQYEEQTRQIPLESENGKGDLATIFSKPKKTDQYYSEKLRADVWRQWTGAGAYENSPHAYCLRTKPFSRHYADMPIGYTVSSNYRIKNAVAFLEKVPDPLIGDSYRPILRQMPVDVVNDFRTVTATLEKPDKGERVLLFIQVGEGSQMLPVDVSKCFLKDYLEIR